jgi:uncharacterized delta-60 repeat protein
MFFTPFAFVRQPFTVTVPPSLFTGYYIGGSFTSYGNTFQPYFRMLDSSGSISSSFNQGTGFNSSVYALATQSDGKIIAGGIFTTYSGSSAVRIARLNTNGTLDTTFKTGTAGANAIVYSTSVQSDQKVIIAGTFTAYSGSTKNNITRINTDGTSDSTFNSGAGVTPATIYATAIQSDGKIIAVGTFTSYSGSARNYVVRINTDGTADTGSSWNQGNGASITTNCIAIQSDQKILIGGAFGSYSGSTATRVTRINTNGTRDTTYNVGAGYNGTVQSIAIQSDGKVLVGGAFTTYSGSTANYIIRTNISGTIDNTFNIGTGFDSTVWGIAIQPDGKIITQGSFTSYSGSVVNGVARLNTDGTLDTTFNRGMTISLAQLNAPVLALSNNSTILGGAYTGYRNNPINALNSSGNPTPQDSVYRYFNGSVNAIIAQSDSKIIAGGNFTTYSGSTKNYIVRLNTDGTADTGSSWNQGNGANSTVLAAVTQSDGKILIGGSFTSYSGSSIARIARLNTNGTRDTTLTVGGGANGNVNAIVVQADGKIVIGGVFSQYSGSTKNFIERINSNGTSDTGSTWNTGVGFGNTVNSIALQSDQKIIVGGAFTTYSGSTKNYIVRLNTDGTADTGSSWNQGVGFGQQVNSLGIQSDGKIIVGGQFTSYSGSASGNTRIIRLNTNGTIDSTFVTGTGFNSQPTTMVQEQGTGKLVLGGAFTTYSGSTANRIIRLNTNGTIDNTFTPVSGGFGGTVSTIIPY